MVGLLVILHTSHHKPNSQKCTKSVPTHIQTKTKQTHTNAEHIKKCFGLVGIAPVKKALRLGDVALLDHPVELVIQNIQKKRKYKKDLTEAIKN